MPSVHLLLTLHHVGIFIILRAVLMDDVVNLPSLASHEVEQLVVCWLPSRAEEGLQPAADALQSAEGDSARHAGVNCHKSRNLQLGSQYHAPGTHSRPEGVIELAEAGIAVHEQVLKHKPPVGHRFPRHGQRRPVSKRHMRTGNESKLEKTRAITTYQHRWLYASCSPTPCSSVKLALSSDSM